MKRHNDLLELERAAWEALCAGGDAAVAYYDKVLAKDVLMLFPGGMVIDDREQVVDSMRGEVDLVRHHRGAGVRPDARQCRPGVSRGGLAPGDADEYNALLNSTYVREGDEWRLALHQQTPV